MRVLLLSALLTACATPATLKCAGLCKEARSAVAYCQECTERSREHGRSCVATCAEAGALLPAAAEACAGMSGKPVPRPVQVAAE